MTIDKVVLERVVVYARAAVPDECCGILLGALDWIVDAIPAANIATDPRRQFEIDPKAHIEARRDARRRGLEVVGFYHSHPVSDARPSARDLDQATYPGLLYLIVGLGAKAPDVRIYRLEGGNFRETTLVPVT